MGEKGPFGKNRNLVATGEKAHNDQYLLFKNLTFTTCNPDFYGPWERGLLKTY